MYDVHAHILPGVDDGPKALDESLRMAAVAAQHGTQVMLCTPHRKDVTENSSVEYIRDLVAELNEKLRAMGVELELLLGMENHLDLDLPDEVMAGRALPIGNTRYILVEMPFTGRPIYLEDKLYQLQSLGFTPILAHPERIETFQRDPELLLNFVNRGMLSQITAGSTVGVFGRRVQQFTTNLLKRNLVHVVASDTHRPDGPRSPKLGPGIAAVTRLVGETSAMGMVIDTPRAILGNLPVEVDKPRSYDSVRRWWQFWSR